MGFKIQLVVCADEGQPDTTHEVAVLEKGIVNLFAWIQLLGASQKDSLAVFLRRPGLGS